MNLIYTLPFISALIGWLTNWIAIQMLFYPKEEINVYFFKWRGIFPANQAEIAAKLGKVVADELISSEDIKKIASAPEQLKQLHDQIELKIDEYLFVKFPQKHRLISAVLPLSKLIELKTEILHEVDIAIPEVLNSFLSTIEDKFDVSAIISERMKVLEVEKLENLLMSLLEREFRFVEIVGGVIGFLIGLFQMLITIYAVN